MITIRPFEVPDLALVDLQPAQAAWRERIARPEYAESLAKHPAWTGEDERSRVVGCAGFVPTLDGHLRAWALLGAIPPRDWTRLVRDIRRIMADTLRDRPRIEACVASGFGPGCKLMRVLGFNVDGILPRFGAKGEEFLLYSKVAA